MPRIHLLILLLALAAASVAAEDGGTYPMLFGDTGRSNHSAATGLLQAWPDGGPKLRWQVAGVGESWTTPVVADGVVYTIGKHERQGLITALDLATGAKRWTATCRRAKHDTPTIVGKRLVIGATDTIACHAVSDGTELWSISLSEHAKLAGGTKSAWRTIKSGNSPDSASPLVFHDRVIATPAFPNLQVAALDLQTGKPVWEVTDLELPQYAPAAASPLGIEVDGRAIVVTCLSDHIVGIDVRTGTVLWTEQVQDTSTVSRMYPQHNTLIWHQGLLVWLPGYSNKEAWPARAWRLEQQGAALVEAWRGCDIYVKHEGAIAVDGRLYGSARRLDDGKAIADAPALMVQGHPVSTYPEDWRSAWRRRGSRKFPPHGAKSDFAGKSVAAWREDPTLTGSALACVDLATGKLLGLRFGPKVHSHCGHNHHYADGRLYIMNSGNGTEVFLIEPGPAMTLRGRLPIPAPLTGETRKELYAMPVVAGTTLLLRRWDGLMAFDVGAQ